MVSTRQDAWSQEEDLLLADVVLRCIREGGTQLQAFEEVGKELSRTAAACGFRWNSAIRKQYKSGIEVAKKQRKKSKYTLLQEQINREEMSSVAPQEPSTVGSAYRFEDVVSYLRGLYEQSSNQDSTSSEELEKYKHFAGEQEEAYKALLFAYEQLEEEYKELIGFLDKALTKTTSKDSTFTMRSNGYLQR